MRRALAVVLGLILAGATAIAAIPTAAAAEPLVTVELTSITMSGSTPADRIELRGRVSNPTGAQVFGLRVGMWRSRDPIDELAGVRQGVIDSSPRGFILENVATAYHTLLAQGEAFPAGATTDFAVTATLDQLGFDTADRAYLVGARALGTTDGGGAFGNVGQAVTVVAVPGKQTVPVTRVVVLTAPPTKLSADIFRNEDLLAALQGRLNTLLDAAGSPGMSWLIDPSLYDEVVDMADGYQVQTGDSLSPGTGQTVAAEWLARFRKLDQRAGGRTLFANPDLTGAALAGDPEVPTRAIAATEQVSQLDHLPLVAVPTGQVYAPPDAALSEQLGDAPVLATNLVTAGALQAAPDGRSVLASAVSLGTDQPSFDGTQLVLAETLVAGAAGQVRVLAEPGDLIADRATTAAWMTSRLLGDLLATGPATRTAEFAEVTPMTLSAGQFRAVEELGKHFATYRELAPESTITKDTAAVLTRAAATAWIVDPEGQEGLLSAFDALVGPSAMARAVTLDASPRFVMSARSNQFPLTVTNHLTEPIKVKVVISTDNPQRLTIPETPVISIPAGQSQTVTVQPEAAANGVAIANARVVTQKGQRVTPDTRITVEMTELGFIGWVIVIASGLVVVGATVLRIRQVRRRTAAQPTPTVEPSPEAVSPAEAKNG